MLSPGDAPMRQIVMPMSKIKDDLTKTQIHGENMIWILRAEVKVMIVYDTLSHGDSLMSQIWHGYAKEQKSFDPNHVKNPIILTLRSMRHIVLGDRPMCQI